MDAMYKETDIPKLVNDSKSEIRPTRFAWKTSKIIRRTESSTLT